MPRGYVTSLEGTFKAQEEAALVIGFLSLVSLTLIFLVLYQRYQSAVLAAIILANIPLALIGSVVALWLAGQPFSVASMIGFITLAGITARNGILKISHYINLALFEGETFGRRLVIRGSLERLAAGADDRARGRVWRSSRCCLAPASLAAKSCIPLRVTIFGGLISATLIDTILTPLMFLRFGGRPLQRIAEARALEQGQAGPAQGAPGRLSEAF